MYLKILRVNYKLNSKACKDREMYSSKSSVFTSMWWLSSGALQRNWNSEEDSSNQNWFRQWPLLTSYPHLLSKNPFKNMRVARGCRTHVPKFSSSMKLLSKNKYSVCLTVKSTRQAGWLAEQITSVGRWMFALSKDIPFP